MDIRLLDCQVGLTVVVRAFERYSKSKKRTISHRKPDPLGRILADE